MKKTLALIGILILGLGFTIGCKNREAEDNVKNYKYGVIYSTMTDRQENISNYFFCG